MLSFLFDIKVLYFITSIILATFLSLIFYWKNNNSVHPNHAVIKEQILGEKYATPPFVKTGYIETLNAISSNLFPSYLLQWQKDLGNTFQVNLIHERHHPMIVVTGDIDLCREVLNDKGSFKTALYDVYKLVHDEGDDLFTSEGAYWKHSRKSISPAFSSNHVKRMNDVVVTETEQFKKKLDVFALKGESFDAGKEMIRLTLNVITQASFQYDLSTEEAEIFNHELEIVLKEISMGWIPFRWQFGVFIPAVRRARQAGRTLLSFAMKILDSYRKNKSPLKGTVIDLIANNAQYKSDKERASDILILLVAGHDTTAYTLAWTLLELGRNPVEQLKLQQDLKLYPLENRNNSPILNHVIKESMRLRTVAPLGSPREICRDIIIRKNETNKLERDLFIPEDSLVLCTQILLNHNTNYHSDPYEFKPSRWANPTTLANASLIPFSLGRRNCIGQSLAKAEIVNVLSRLCVDYTFSVESEGSVDLIMTHQPVEARLNVSKSVCS